MSLQFVIGRSGSGKTHTIYQHLIKESIEQEYQNYFLIVPEQYTLQTQKDVIEKHPGHGTMNIDVVSFPRLAYRIFEELSYFPNAVLEDMGKRMVLRKILEEQKDHLKVFGSSIRKQGFVENMKSMISELYQYRVKPEQLEELQDGGEGNLNYKLHDLALIEYKFQEFLENHFIVAEQILEELAAKVECSEKLRDSVIYIDGFTGFTPVQNQLIGTLLKYAKRIVISVTADSWMEERKFVQEYELFSMSSKTIRQLKELANAQGVSILPSILLTEKVPYRLKEKEDLAALEAGIFRYPVKVYEKEIRHITLFTQKDALEEVHRICERMEYYVREKGYRYRDMAVIVGDMESYSMHFEQCFGELHIPYFMDHKKSILNNPCVETIRGVFQIVQENFSYESVFRYLKAGMSGLNPEQVDRLENYVIARGIRGKKRWMEEFTVLISGQTEADLAELNKSREQFLDEVFDFDRACKEKENTARDYMEALYQFLRKCRMEEQMEMLRQQFEECRDYVMEKTYSQIYPYMIGLMDKVVSILGNDRMTIEEVTKILETGLEEMSIGVIPPGVDQVVVGDLTRTRLNDIKVLFFAGMNESFIPKPADGGGILNDHEREMLEEKGLQLAETVIQSAYTEQLYLYLAISKPTEHLYLSYVTVGNDGSSMRPSYFIQRIQKVLPKLKLTDMESSGVYTKEYGMHQFIRGLRTAAEGGKQQEWKVIGKMLLDEKAIRSFLNAACYRNYEENLSYEAAKRIYGEVLQNSISRLEQFEACAYAHFLRYGLKLYPRQEFKIQAPDLGNIFHRALEMISKKIQVTYEDWNEIDDKEQKILTEEAVNKAISEWNEELLSSSHRNQYVAEIIKRMTRRTLWALVKHLENSDFKPYAFEVTFSSYENLESANMELDHGVRMRLNGKIDRIDRYEDEDGIYLKVIDYKSGYAKFDLMNLYYGLQLQLVLYMNAVLEIEEKKADGKPVIPAGMFYYSLKDPIVDQDLEQDAQELILKKLQMDGYVNSDHHIIEHMERDLPKKCASIPVSRTKSGYSAYSKILDTKTFQNIQEYAVHKMLEAGNDMVNGKISIHPYRRKKETACDFCEYKEICHFDHRLDAYRDLVEKKEKDLLEMWKGESEDGLDKGTEKGH
ncbi:MAG: helicase-exonuclease AddAB subunit AddB [Lachnospiraceae bacterium]|nr:helicase-exonuclease AddAB subunit AddB [Lachnospiraceae bacterium]